MTEQGRHPREYVDVLLEAMDNAGIGLLVVGDHGDRIDHWYANRTAAEIWGRTPDELLATPVFDALPPAEAEKMRALRAELNAGTRAVTTPMETEVEHPDGTRVPVEIGFARHPMPGGWVSIVFVRDIRRRRRTQTALLEADRMAAIGALAAGVAHEINNPLTYVLLHLASLRRSLERWVVPAEQARVSHILDEITEGADRVRVIVRELLTFAEPVPSFAGVDVTTVVGGVIQLVTPTLKHRARIVAELGAAPRVAGDHARLGQAVLNLILNAGSGFAGDAPERNQISVRVAEQDGAAIVEITDNGAPVDDEAASHAFEPFFRLRDGCGVGLAVTRSIAEAMHGSITLAVRRNGGPIVTLRLPAAPSQD